MENLNHIKLGNFDTIAIITYLVILLIIGFYFRKYSQKGVENYFLAGRKLPGWVNGISAAATAMNADVAPTYCGMTVISGLFIYWFYISRFGLALMVAAVLFALFWRKLKIFTAPEFYELRFSGKIASTLRGWIAFRSAFISIVAWTGAGLLGLHKILNPTLGWSLTMTFSIVIPVVLIYVFMSGYIGVVFSDVLQAAIVFISYLILAILVIKDFGGPSGLYDALVSTHGTDVVRWFPPLNHESLGLVSIIAWTLGTAIGYGGDVAPMGAAMEGQRILSCKNGKEASKLYIWALFTIILMLTILTMPALGAMVKWPGLYTGEINKEKAFGLLISHYMPPGILWLAIAGLAASIMSTIDSNLNFGSQTVVYDLYRRFFVKGKDEKHYLKVGKAVIFLIIGLSMLVAVKAKNVIDIAIFMLGISSAELSANWAQWWWWRFNSKARITASFGGPIIFILVKFVIFTSLSPYWHVFISIAITTILWVLVALVTAPEKEEVLIKFYQEAKPLGFWKPIADKAGNIPQNTGLILQGFGLAFLGMLPISLASISIAHCYIGKGKISYILLFFIILLLIFFKNCYRKYIDKLETRIN
ncbi:MAG: hypothetical protein JXQ65_02070 [Candidatus Marinimicrobia bacterium]|nr:hypothetical protein [Candidatus Neomarinimicrobiota bacterium]